MQGFMVQLRVWRARWLGWATFPWRHSLRILQDLQKFSAKCIAAIASQRACSARLLLVCLDENSPSFKGFLSLWPLRLLLQRCFKPAAHGDLLALCARLRSGQ